MRNSFFAFMLLLATSIISFAQIRDISQTPRSSSTFDGPTIERIRLFNYLGNEIWLFTDANYSGKKKVIKVEGATDYRLADLGGEWNDTFSSILVPRGIAVTLFEHDNFNIGQSGAIMAIVGRGLQDYARNGGAYVSNGGYQSGSQGVIGAYIDIVDFTNVQNADYYERDDKGVVRKISRKGVQSDASDRNDGFVINFNDKTSSIRVDRYAK